MIQEKVMLVYLSDLAHDYFKVNQYTPTGVPGAVHRNAADAGEHRQTVHGTGTDEGPCRRVYRGERDTGSSRHVDIRGIPVLRR